MALTIDLGRFESCVTNAIGPGRRAGLWVRGCPFRCPGCCSPEFQQTGQSENAVDVSRVIDWIKLARREHNTEGITFSGGEPFLQAEALAEVAKVARQLGLSVQCWTGYTLEELRAPNAPHQAVALLQEIDVLIDGRFEQDQPSAPMRGSVNQRIYFLTGRYDETHYTQQPLELRLDSLGSLTSFGVVRPRTFEIAWRLLGLNVGSDSKQH